MVIHVHTGARNTMWRVSLKSTVRIVTLLCIIGVVSLLRSSTNVQEESILPVAGNVHSLVNCRKLFSSCRR